MSTPNRVLCYQCPEAKGIVQEGTQHGTESVFTKRVRCICRLGLIRVTSARTSSCTMVYLDRDPAAASLIHESCGFFDRLRSVHFRSLRLACSTGDIDGSSGRTSLYGYSASSSSGRS